MLGTTNASSTSPFAIENYAIDVLSQSTIRTQHERNGNGFQDSIVFACLPRPITQMYLDELVETPVNAREGVSRRLGQVEIP